MADPFAPVPFAEAIAWARARQVTLPDVYYGELQGLARSMAFSIAGMAKLDQLQAVMDSLAEATANGESFGAWKKRATTQALDLPAHRIESIFRTNIQGHYGRGRCEQQKRNVVSHPWYLYDAVNDSRTRPSHAAMDGMVARHDDPIWDVWTPSCGYQCRCRRIALSERQADRFRAADFKRLQDSEALTARMNAQPDKGWDYNPCAEPTEGLRRAWEAKVGKAHPALAQAANQAAANIPEAPPIPVVAPALPVYREAISKAGAKKATEEIIGARGAIDYAKGATGNDLQRFRHIGTKDAIKDRYGKASAYGFEPPEANEINRALVAMAADADALNIPRVRGVTGKGSSSASASMGDGVLYVSKSLKAGDGPRGYASARKFLEAELAQAKAALALAEDYKTKGYVNTNADYLPHWIARVEAAAADLARLDLGESDDAVMRGRVSTWVLGDHGAKRPSSTGAYFWRESDKLTKTLWHEFGHHIHQQLGVTDPASYLDPPMERLLRKLKNEYKDGPSTYSFENQKEWFAESFAMYKMGRRDLVPPPLLELIDALYRTGGTLPP